ncbi:MAG: HEAT repeat domain-containing protein, partial [Planctomycetota bacterium]
MLKNFILVGLCLICMGVAYSDEKTKATPERIKDLIEQLGDADSFFRGRAAEALGNLGYKEAAPEISKLLNDKEPSVRGSAAYSLGKLGYKEAAPKIIKLLNDKNASVR